MHKQNGRVAGLYSKMIHGTENAMMVTAGEKGFGAGLSTISVFSSMNCTMQRVPAAVNYITLNINQLTTARAAMPGYAWTSAYKTVYDANAVLKAWLPPPICWTVRKELRGE